jgi:hypothetical protein
MAIVTVTSTGRVVAASHRLQLHHHNVAPETPRYCHEQTVGPSSAKKQKRVVQSRASRDQNKEDIRQERYGVLADLKLVFVARDLSTSKWEDFMFELG